MRGWFQKMNWNMQRFMKGRNGHDELNNFLTIFALVMMILSGYSEVFLVIGFVCLALTIFRCYSRNLEKRQRERDAWLRLIAKPKNWFALQGNRWRDRKTHKYYKCANCKTVLRVPKGKGKIEITCPRCHKINTHKT